VIENIDYNNLNYLDITLIALLVILAIKGFVNGLIKELFGAIGLVGGIILASKEHPVVSQYIHQNIYPLDNPALLNLAGFIAILVASWIIASIIGSIVSYFANKNSKMGLIGRLMGMGISGAKYFLLFSIIIVSLLKIALIKDAVEPRLDLNSSITYPYVEEYGEQAIKLDVMRVIQSKSFEESFKKEKTKSNDKRQESNSTLQENNITVKRSDLNAIIVKDK